jgi:cardiolipin synthase
MLTLFVEEFWPYIVFILTLFIAVVASVHAVLNKREVRAAIGWSGLIWLAPIVGSVLYVTFGINRIKRRASRIRGAVPDLGRAASSDGEPTASAALEAEFRSCTKENILSLSDYVTRATRRPLTHGNAVKPLEDGDQAYPAMIAAIRAAERSIALCSYIYDNDRAGLMFVEALSDAVQRGVAVRVLIDGVGARYSDPPIPQKLRELGVPVAEFLKSVMPLRNPYLNLRNHRKILVVDGRIGFAGGLNIREGCLLELDTAHPVRDLHFRFEGPVVRSLMETFAIDWGFTTQETLSGDRWYPPLEAAGDVTARGIPDGPDEDYETVFWTILGGLTCARESVRITTPYFLPDQVLISALGLTAMRGVEVDIVVPEKCNLRFVNWAASAQAGQILERGCRIWLSEPPFDHGKLMIVDDAWSFVGSSNWDPRSLRLNFELNVECYDEKLATDMSRLIDQRIETSRRLTLREVDQRSLPVKVRDGVTWLFSPYL